MFILTFKTIIKALEYEEKLEKYNARIIPLPPELSKGCGFCLEIDTNEYNLKEILKFNNVEYIKIYKKIYINNKRKCESIDLS